MFNYESPNSAACLYHGPDCKFATAALLPWLVGGGYRALNPTFSPQEKKNLLSFVSWLPLAVGQLVIATESRDDVSEIWWRTEFKVEQTKVYDYVSYSAPQNHEWQKPKDLRSWKNKQEPRIPD